MNNIRKVLVVYHRVDCDGVSSFMISRRYYESKGLHVEGLGWNYGEDLPDIEAILKEYSTITLVDISFPADIMLKLYESRKFVWIDHHITAIDDSIAHGYNDSVGIRKVGSAACKLCWEYFNPKTEVPLAVELLSEYDVWDKNGSFDWNEVVYPFQVGIKDQVELNLSLWGKIWDELVQDEYNEADDEIVNSMVSDIVEKGSMLIEFDKKRNKVAVRKYGFEVTVDGKYKGICLLSPVFGSTAFESVLDEYDIYIVVNRIKKNYYNVSFYKEPDRLPEFSCGKYLMANYQGGGHDSAAGGVLDIKGFTTLIEDCVI